jgi:hypothetical protein
MTWGWWREFFWKRWAFSIGVEEGQFYVDLAGQDEFNEEIRSAIHYFITDLPIESSGDLKAGEHRLPDGRIMLLTTDARICLMA